MPLRVAVAPVHEAVHGIGRPRPCGPWRTELKVVDMAVHAAIRKQTRQACRRSCAQIQSDLQHRIGGKTAVFQRHVDAGHILIYHTPSADVQMPHFRIAHA